VLIYRFWFLSSLSCRRVFLEPVMGSIVDFDWQVSTEFDPSNP
jgi:hypothetical protein